MRADYGRLFQGVEKSRRTTTGRLRSQVRKDGGDPHDETSWHCWTVCKTLVPSEDVEVRNRNMETTVRWEQICISL